jgi:hypothetical protein
VLRRNLDEPKISRYHLGIGERVPRMRGGHCQGLHACRASGLNSRRRILDDETVPGADPEFFRRQKVAVRRGFTVRYAVTRHQDAGLREACLQESQSR